MVEEAFAVHREPDRVRDAYGRNSVGEKALLARRLVEAGTTFVLVSGAWGYFDHHGDNVPPWGGIQRGLTPILPTIDRALSVFAVLTRDGEDVGYALYRIKSEWLNTGPANTLIVLELIGVDADAVAQLWRYVFGVDLMSTIAHRPPDHPLAYDRRATPSPATRR
jgi:hypothetical protein